MKSIAICGSRRFKPEIRALADELTAHGVIVYAPFLHSGSDEWNLLSEDYKKFIALGLTHDHFYKIRMADVVYIYNKDGYAGPSTTMELAYAVAMGKPVYALSDEDPEICRLVLYRGFVGSTRRLVELLR